MTESVKSIRLDRLDRQISLLLAVIALALYLRTLSPELLAGDPGEFQVAAWRLGLAHPTGYPFYLLIGNVWQHLLAWFGLAPSTALNALSAVFAALDIGLLYLLMRRWMPGSFPLSRAVAIFPSLLFAANFTFWSQAVIAEVYTLQVTFILILLLLVQGPTPAAYFQPAPVATVDATSPSTRQLVSMALVIGFGLTHHGTILLLLPPLILFLQIRSPGWWRRSWHAWFAIVLAGFLPLLLYVYIPLRSSASASPWYHQRLGAGVLELYENSWSGFLTFLSGRSISVGFHDLTAAIGSVPEAAWLWWYHFRWPGLLLISLGIAILVRRRAWPVLVLTITYVGMQQLFNLFYAIGDILVYYLPLYLVGVIWVGFGVDSLVNGRWRSDTRDSLRRQHDTVAPAAPDMADSPERDQQANSTPGNVVGWLVLLFLFLIPVRALPETSTQVDQSGNRTTRMQWERILATDAPRDAILISNDRDEIVPLFYLQHVEDRAQSHTGLFPSITPNTGFGDIGATIDTALTAGSPQPVYLIKAMPGLEIKFDLEPAQEPLVQVLGPVSGQPQEILDQPFGPLTLQGITKRKTANGLESRLYWQVEKPLTADYTTTVQLFDGAGNRLAQDDHPPGGIYYPTSLWKPGERLVTTHQLVFEPTSPLPVDSSNEAVPATILIGMYTGPELAPLAPPIELPISEIPESQEGATRP